MWNTSKPPNKSEAGLRFLKSHKEVENGVGGSCGLEKQRSWGPGVQIPTPLQTTKHQLRESKAGAEIELEVLPGPALGFRRRARRAALESGPQLLQVFLGTESLGASKAGVTKAANKTRETGSSEEPKDRS